MRPCVASADFAAGARVAWRDAGACCVRVAMQTPPRSAGMRGEVGAVVRIDRAAEARGVRRLRAPNTGVQRRGRVPVDPHRHLCPAAAAAARAQLARALRACRRRAARDLARPEKQRNFRLHRPVPRAPLRRARARQQRLRDRGPAAPGRVRAPRGQRLLWLQSPVPLCGLLPAPPRALASQLARRQPGHSRRAR